jgi:CheY-like chemotaxis protein
MEKPLQILLVEDERTECEEIQSYTDSLDDVSLIAATASSADALSIVYEKQPDAVILDLELHDGSGNGLMFLMELEKRRPAKRPYILITTNNSSRTTHEAARQLGADFIITKYEDGYCAQYVIDFLRMMRKIIAKQTVTDTVAASTPTYFSDSTTENTSAHFTGSTTKNTSAHFTDSASPQPALEQKEPVLSADNLNTWIYEQLNLIGINPKSVGYRYLADAIRIKYEDPDAHLLAALAPIHKKSDASIERAMQNAINRAWRISDPEDLLTNYTARIHSERGVPTIMEFIFYYSTKLRNLCPPQS